MTRVRLDRADYTLLATEAAEGRRRPATVLRELIEKRASSLRSMALARSIRAMRGEDGDAFRWPAPRVRRGYKPVVALRVRVASRDLDELRREAALRVHPDGTTGATVSSLIREIIQVRRLETSGFRRLLRTLKPARPQPRPRLTPAEAQQAADFLVAGLLNLPTRRRRKKNVPRNVS